MRGDIVYRVYGRHRGRDEDCYFGTFRTVSDAEAKIAKLSASEMNGRNWSEQHHNLGFIIREVTVDIDFEIPSQPSPRDKYFITGTPKGSPGTWPSTLVEVFERGAPNGGMSKVCEYVRNYSLLQTFEPFRQGDRDFALISPRYTSTCVLDLQSGQIIAEEVASERGFCPVGFYVPDWWDVNDGSTIPGSVYWSADHEWPNGNFGFVWGCIWGDDSSWKVQYLDLSDVQRGAIRRDERFGYVELATSGFDHRCQQLSPPATRSAPHFIDVSRYEGVAQVRFAVEMEFDLESGKSTDWERRRIKNLE